MHARMARYTFIGDPQELPRKAEDGMLPMFESEPGFKGYSITVTSQGEILSFSIWRPPSRQRRRMPSRATGSRTTSRPGQIEPTETRVGEVLLSTALGVAARSPA